MAETKAQPAEYDQKVHGAGTAPVEEPSSVKELFHKIVKPLMDTVQSLKDRTGAIEARPLPPDLTDRVEALEAKEKGTVQ